MNNFYDVLSKFMDRYDFIPRRIFETFVVTIIFNIVLMVLENYVLNQFLKDLDLFYPVLLLIFILIANFFFMRLHRNRIHGHLKYYAINSAVILFTVLVGVISCYLIKEPFFTYLFCSFKWFYIMDYTTKVKSVLICGGLLLIDMFLAQIGQGYRRKYKKTHYGKRFNSSKSHHHHHHHEHN